jgi:hypothetical protein
LKDSEASRAKAFVKAHKLKLNGLQEARIKTMEESDKLCVQCKRRRGMMCPGLRDYFNDQTSATTGKLVIDRRFCSKLSGKQLDREDELRRERSLIPAPVFNRTVKHVSVEADGIVYDGMQIPHKTMFSCAVSDYAQIYSLVCDILVAFHLQGASVRYVFPSVLTRKESWESLGILELGDADVLCIVRPERLPGAEWMRNELESILIDASVQSKILLVVSIDGAMTTLTEFLKTVCEVISV